jgi:hypothetical protein
MSKNREEVARELAKLASLMDPSGAEEHIGEVKASPVSDSERGSILIHNFNYDSDIVARAAQAPVLPQEDLNPPSLAEVQARAQAIYGDQSHNSDFYPKGLDAMNEMLHGHSPVVASKRKLAKFAAKYGEELKLVYDIAEELVKRAGFDAASIGSARNEGPAVQDRIDSNKGLGSVQAAFRHEPLPEVTSYGAPAFEASMDTGGFEGAMPVQASVEAPVTRRKQVRLASTSESLASKLASLSPSNRNKFAALIQKGDFAAAESLLGQKKRQ